MHSMIFKIDNYTESSKPKTRQIANSYLDVLDTGSQSKRGGEDCATCAPMLDPPLRSLACSQTSNVFTVV